MSNVSTSEFRVVTIREFPELRAVTNKLAVESWVEFMMHDPVTNHMSLLWDRCPEYQFALLNERDEAVVAANSVPLPWNGRSEDLPDTGLDWMLSTFAAHESYAHLNQFAIQVMVRRDYLGHGLSARAVTAMGEIGRAHGCRNLFAPVRPNRKCDYPLIPMERYVRWTREDGLPFDPWIRVHARLGADLVKVCPQSMYIPGTIAEWETWTGLKMPESGSYVVPGALVPVTVNREKDLAEYTEPNVWMRHPLV